jgi:hypothetical protein
MIFSTSILLTLGAFLLPGSAFAAATNCPDTWNLSTSKIPVSDSDQIYTNQMALGRAMSAQLMSVAYSVDGKTFKTVNLNARVPSALDATPISLAVDRSLSLLVSGKPIKASYAFRVNGCSAISTFAIPGTFQSVKIIKTSFPAHLKSLNTYTDSLNPGGLPEIKLFNTPKSLASASTDLANCQKNIIKAVQTAMPKGSKLSQHFSDACPMAGGKWSEIRILQEGSDCLVRQDDSGPTNFYAVKQGATCKVALARVLGDDPNITKVLGPKVAYIFAEFSLNGKWATAKAVSPKKPVKKK